jgi:hypothetical protein
MYVEFIIRAGLYQLVVVMVFRIKNNSFDGPRDGIGRHIVLRMQVLRVRVSPGSHTFRLVGSGHCTFTAKTRVRIP